MLLELLQFIVTYRNDETKDVALIRWLRHRDPFGLGHGWQSWRRNTPGMLLW